MDGGIVHSIFYDFFAKFMTPQVAAVVSVIASILLAALIVVVFVKLNNLVFNKVIRGGELHERFLHSLGNFVCIFLGFILAAMFLGYSKGLGRLMLGSTGLAIAIVGFAAQAAIGDIISGLMIGITRPYELGDRIVLEGTGISGTVRDMTVRHTVIHRFDGHYVMVPNSVMSSSIIHNDSYHRELTGSYLDIGISYDSDIKLAMKVIHDAVIGCRYTVEYIGDNPEGRRAAVYMTEYAASAIMLRTSVWARNSDELFMAKSEIMIKIKEDFDHYGIEIPFQYVNVVEHQAEEKNTENAFVVEPDEIYEDETVEVMKSVSRFCQRYKIVEKDTLHLRLLSEELMEIMKNYKGRESYFNITMGKGNNCELHYKVKSGVKDSDRKFLKSLDTTGNDTSLPGMMRQLMENYSMGAVSDNQWSLARYREAVSRGDVPEKDIGKSIISKLADDIRINTKNDITEIVIVKEVHREK